MSDSSRWEYVSVNRNCRTPAAQVKGRIGLDMPRGNASAMLSLWILKPVLTCKEVAHASRRLCSLSVRQRQEVQMVLPADPRGDRQGLSARGRRADGSG